MKWLCPKCNAVNHETSGICNNCYTLKPADLPAEYLVDDPNKLLVAGSPIPSGAGFGIRCLARSIDAIIVACVSIAVGQLAGVVFALLAGFGLLTPRWPFLVSRLSIGSVALAQLAGLLYHAIAEGVGSVTVGKLICNLRVVQIDGKPVNMWAAFFRNLAFYIDGQIFGFVGSLSMDKSLLRQRYGDVWAKTVVVRKRDFAPIGARSGLRVALGIAASLLILGSLLALNMFLKVI